MSQTDAERLQEQQAKAAASDGAASQNGHAAKPRTRRPTPAKAQAPDVPNDTDRGNATRFAKTYVDELRYVDTWKGWLYWDGQRWFRDELRTPTRKAKELLGEMMREAAREIEGISQALKEGDHAE
jgi:hypothetical protein